MRVSSTLAARDLTTAHPFQQESLLRVHRGLVGRGVFARKALTKGAIVCTLDGPRIDGRAYRQLTARNRNKFSQIGPNDYVGQTNGFDDLFNHSCEPNLLLRERHGDFVFVCWRAVRAGEEMTWDYACVVTDSYTKFRCRCGSRSCRKEISTFLKIPFHLKSLYARAGGSPPYVFQAELLKRQFSASKNSLNRRAVRHKQ